MKNENKIYISMEEIEKDFFPDDYIENQNSIIIENPTSYGMMGAKLLKVRCPYCGSENAYIFGRDIFNRCDNCHEGFKFKITKLYKITTIKMEANND